MAVKKEVQSVPFRVYFTDGREPEEYLSSDESKYLWMVGMTGELNIVNNIVNTQFSVTVEENRIRTIASGVWSEVEVLYDN